jgi:hypothetical protein
MPSPGFADSPVSAQSFPIASTDNWEYAPRTLTGADGGSLVVWLTRFGTAGDRLWVRAFDRDGHPRWPALSFATDSRYRDYDVIADGAGGAFVTYGGTGLRAQHVLHDGTTAGDWGSGVLINNDRPADWDWRPAIASDDSGGVIVAWTGARDTTPGFLYDDLRAQRVDALGRLRWDPGGASVCLSPVPQDDPLVVSDGAGGAIVTWSEVLDLYRPGGHVRAQRLDDHGRRLWILSGTMVRDSVGLMTEDYGHPRLRIVPDGAGGAVLAWEDARDLPAGVYVQRVDAAGQPQWAANGQRVSVIAGGETEPSLAADGLGGTYVAWLDGRSGGELFAQRLRLDGTRWTGWQPDGNAVGPGSSGLNPSLTTDGVGNVFLGWEDGLSEATRVQQLTPYGVIALGWPQGGFVLGNGVPVVAAVGDGTCIAAWSVYSSAHAEDVLGARIGPVPPTSPFLALELAGPHPAVGSFRVRLALPSTEPARLELFDVSGRLTASRTLADAAGQVVDIGPSNARPGVYLLRLSQGGRTTEAKGVLLR